VLLGRLRRKFLVHVRKGEEGASGRVQRNIPLPKIKAETDDEKHHISLHLASLRGAFPFRCRWGACNETVETQSLLAKHLATHSNVKITELPFCLWKGCDYVEEKATWRELAVGTPWFLNTHILTKAETCRVIPYQPSRPLYLRIFLL
jgi:hypothetical protein